ncbi:hypothetical protein PV325_008606 [Microctonus aethiopoides]|nr:hypothetical protein PV325_008606 [Microctonus aethiopoides]
MEDEAEKAEEANTRRLCRLCRRRRRRTTRGGSGWPRRWRRRLSWTKSILWPPTPCAVASGPSKVPTKQVGASNRERLDDREVESGGGSRLHPSGPTPGPPTTYHPCRTLQA